MAYQWYWHVHHDVLVEQLYEPIERRVEYIRKRKPAHEIATRLRLLRPVRKELTADIDALEDAEAQAWKDYNAAFYAPGRSAEPELRAAVRAQDAHHLALYTFRDALQAAHATECPDCPWDGTTIFPDHKSHDPR